MTDKDNTAFVDQAALDALQLRLRIWDDILDIVALAIKESTYTEAAEALSKIALTCPVDAMPKLLMWRGRMLRYAGRYQEALSDLEEAAKSISDSEPCLPCDIALVKANLGRIAEAIGVLSQLEDSGKCVLPTELYLHLAQLHLHQTSPKHEIVHSGDPRSIARESPTDGNTCNCSAVVYFNKALRISDDPIDWHHWQAAGNAAGNAGLHEFSINCFKTMLSLPDYPGSFEPLYYIALGYFSMGRFDSAVGYLDRINASDFALLPDSARAVAGIALMHRGRYEEALQHLQVWCESTTNKGSAYTLIGNACALSGRNVEARDRYNLAITAPDYLSADAWNNMGIMYAREGDLKASEACFHRLTENNSELPWKSAIALYNLALATRCNGNVSDSAVLFEQAAKQFDDCHRFHDAQICAALARPSHISRDSILLSIGYRYLGMPEPHDPLDELRSVEAATVLKQHEYLAAFDNRAPAAVCDNCLVVLKGWSSSEPLYAGQEQSVPGGGLLLRWRGNGIAIDPGINYLKNLHASSYHIQDIDGIVVTHDHIDHNHDLRAIDDLVYQASRYAQYRKRRLIFLARFIHECGSMPKNGHVSALSGTYADLEAVALVRESASSRFVHSPHVPASIIAGHKP